MPPKLPQRVLKLPSRPTAPLKQSPKASLKPPSAPLPEPEPDSRRFPFPTGKQVFKALWWVPVLVFVTENLISVVSVEGNSMSPTLNPPGSKYRDYLLLDQKARYSAQYNGWHRGDMVTLYSPTSEGRRLAVKRILAIEGDTVRTMPPCRSPTIKIGKGQVWVEGDNLNDSKDSNHYGPVPIALLQSRVIAVISPPSRFKYFPSTSPPSAPLLPWSDRPPYPPPVDPSALYAHRLVLPLTADNIREHAKQARFDGAAGWGGERGLGEGEMDGEARNGSGSGAGRDQEAEDKLGEWERIKERRAKRYSS